MKAVIAGLLVVMGGLGGMEHPTSDAVLVQCVMVFLAGLALMWAGVDGITAQNQNQNN